MRIANAAGLTAGPLTGVWFRAIQPQYWTKALQTTHTRNIPSRFNPGNNQFQVFYLAENHLVALMEVGALVGSGLPGALLPSPQRAWSVINVNVRLSAVVDLANYAQRRIIRTSSQEMTGDWRAYATRHQLKGHTGAVPLAPTQRLGEALYRRANVEAVMTYSAKQPYSRALCIFPTKLQPTSRLSFFDPVTSNSVSMP